MIPFIVLGAAWVALLSIDWLIENWKWEWLVMRPGELIPAPFFLKLYQSGDYWCFNVPMFWNPILMLKGWRLAFVVRCWYIAFGFPSWYHRCIETKSVTYFGWQRGPAYRHVRGIIGPWRHRFMIEHVIWPIHGKQQYIPNEWEQHAEKRRLEINAEEIA